MHDAVIRGGTVIDGTGGARFTGDVALDGARIAAVGAVEERGRSEIDARGLCVVPGWVDIHTHYDGQAYHPFENYNGGSLDEVREMLLDPDTVLGLGDAGAHVAMICDASSPTSLLTHWGRDRVRGEGIPLERLVVKQTSEVARFVGLADRGVLAPGFKADVSVIDFSALSVSRPELVRDLPAGGKRLIQRANGYRHTFLSGVEVLRDDRPTGALPGAVVRGAQAGPR